MSAKVVSSDSLFAKLGILGKVLIKAMTLVVVGLTSSVNASAVVVGVTVVGAAEDLVGLSGEAGWVEGNADIVASGRLLRIKLHSSRIF